MSMEYEEMENRQVNEVKNVKERGYTYFVISQRVIDILRLLVVNDRVRYTDILKISGKDEKHGSIAAYFVRRLIKFGLVNKTVHGYTITQKGRLLWMAMLDRPLTEQVELEIIELQKLIDDAKTLKKKLEHLKDIWSDKNC